MSYTRRFSLEQDFMNYSTDDLLYGALQYLATYHPEAENLYISKKVLTKNKKEIYSLCDLNAQSLKRHLNKLLEAGLIEETQLTCENAEVPVYTFPYNIDDRYQLVDWEMLWYVVSTRNKFAVKIYIYLLNKFLWKQQTNEYYVFTIQEILRAMGYGYNRNYVAESAVKNVLESFSREGVISFCDYYETHILSDGSEVPTPKKRLTFVANNKAEIKTTFSGL